MKKKKYPELPERSHPDYDRLYREMNKEKLKEQRKIKYQANRETILKSRRENYDAAGRAEYRAKNVKYFREKAWKRHGIIDLTYERYLTVLEEQTNRCKICEGEMEMPQADHDHSTGKFRGLLCKTCNFGLGIHEKYKDKFEKYLKEHNE